MIAIEDSETTTKISYNPCIWCKRKNCTISSFYGDRCEFAVYNDDNDDTLVTGYSKAKERNYVKKQKNKKRIYHRGKF